MKYCAKTLIAALILLSSGLSSAQEVRSAAELARQIEAMETEIQQFKKTLEDTQDERTKLETNLEKAEKGINALQKKIQNIESELNTGEDKISRFEVERNELVEQKIEQQRHIEEQIQAAYKLGKQEYLKVVLNQEDPNEVSRMMTYYDYLNRARTEQILKYENTIGQLAVVTEKIATENLRLTQQKDSLAQQRGALLDQRENKQVVLLQLKRQLQETGKALEKRSADHRRLEQLLLRIEDRTATIVAPEDSIAFKGMKGQLVLPVNGKITQRFGARRNAGKMRWRGVFIDAPEGEQVHAVHYGRVVFSDWLRGFGLLLIVNHGQGYMSLYGHNQMIYRETGDWVVAGEAIATVGDTGGQDRSGLYFEIRIDGTPADPQLWCQARRQKAA